MVVLPDNMPFPSLRDNQGNMEGKPSQVGGQRDFPDGQSPPPQCYSPAWWATFWTSNLALTNASSGGLTAGYSNALPITGNVISLVSLILIVIIIRKISANQDRKYSAHRELIQREEENHKRERDTPAKRMIMLRNLLAREDPEIAEKASRGAWLELTPNQRNTVFDTFQKEWKKLDVEQTAARTSVEIAEAMTHTDTTQTELAKMQERAARQIARGLATNNARRFRRGINRAQRIREATASQTNSINPNRQTNRNWGRYTPGPRLTVPVIIVIAALGSIAYWQGLPPFGPSGPGTQAAPLPAGTNQQDTETAPPPTAAATAAVPTPTLAETPTETPAPTAEPTSTSTPRRAPVRAPPPPAPTPTREPVPTKAAAPAPEQTATPAPAPTPTAAPTATPASGPEPVTAEITTLSFVGTGYTLYLRTGSLPGGRSHEPVTLVIRHADGTVQKKTTYLEQRNDGDYRGAVTVGRERVEHDDLQWARKNIEVRVIPESEAGTAKATPEPTMPKPTNTPRPTPTRRPESTPAPTRVNTPTPAPMRINTSTPAPTPTPRRTNTPTPAPGPAAQRNLEEKKYMLELINEERRKAGVTTLTLGDNRAAQLHAETSLAGCFSSHWGMDGLKPYMRYTLAGGQQSNGENWTGLSYCIKESDGYRGNGTPRSEIRQAMTWLMNSPSHRRNILNPSHRKVTIGLAWDPYNFNTIQHFEGNYIKYSQTPAIRNGILSMSGWTRNGAEARDGKDIGFQVSYDPPPHPLTRRQVSRTYCYGSGIPVALLRMPLTGGWHYNEDQTDVTHKPCPGPLRGQPRRARAQLPGGGARVLAERVRRQPGAEGKDSDDPVDHRLGVDRQRGPVLRDRRPARGAEAARKRRIHGHTVGPDGQREDGGLGVLDIPRRDPAQRIPNRPMSGEGPAPIDVI